MGRINDGQSQPENDTRLLSISQQVVKGRENFKKQILIICDGDMMQFNEIMRGGVDTYLLKVELYVEKILAFEKINKKKK